MIDIDAIECSKGMYIYCLAFYLLIIILFYKKYNTYHKFSTVSNRLNPFFALLVLIYVLTSFYNGDYWHYKAFMRYDDFWRPSEDIYDFLANLVGRNYLLYRLVVWGLAFYLLIKIFRRFNLNQNYSLLYFFILYISVFDYARASLAMTIYFLGFTYMIKPICGKLLTSKIFGMALMLSSYFFHHSMIVLIILYLMRYAPINKKIIVLCLVLIPNIGLLLLYVFNMLTGLNADSLELVMMKIDGYSVLETEDVSLLENMRLIWHYSTFFIPFIIVIYKMVFSLPKHKYPAYIFDLCKISLGIIIFSSSCLFLGFNNNVLFYRTLYMSMIPLTVLICYLNEKGCITFKTYRLLILMGAGYTLFRHFKVLLRWAGPIR